MSDNPPPKRPKSRRRKWIALGVLVLLVWRAWPLAATFTGLNLRVSEAPKIPGAGFLPPSSVPDDLRSGLPHPFWQGGRLAAEMIFLPRVIRHGHGFKRDAPALPEATAKQLAELLADPASYEPWGGEKACGGFHGDWYVRWGSGAEQRKAIVCMGCGEVLLYRPGASLRCDLTSNAHKRIAEVTTGSDSH